MKKRVLGLFLVLCILAAGGFTAARAESEPADFDAAELMITLPDGFDGAASPLHEGESCSYTVTVTNASSLTLARENVRLGGGTADRSVSFACLDERCTRLSGEGEPAVYSLPEALAPGETAEIRFGYTVEAESAGETLAFRFAAQLDGEGAGSETSWTAIVACAEHSWDEGMVTAEPGCEAPGVKTFTCTVCGETRAEEIPAQGHDFQWTVTAEPGCEIAGVETEVCTHDAGHTGQSREIPALGHDFQWTVTAEPGCETAGIETEVCTHDANHTGQTREIPALGHEWDAGEETVPAGCSSPGVKTFTCARCQRTRTEEIPALGHRWDAGTVTQSPACGQAGVRTFVCTVCGAARTEAIPALAHAWDAGTVTKAASCTEPGSMLYTCKLDASHTRTEVIPAAGHRFEGGICAVCGAAQPGFVPKITRGSGDVAHYGSDYVIRCDAAPSAFEGLQIDGDPVAPENYTLTEESTLVTLNEAFVRTLSAGSHSFSVETAVGTASGAFSVSTSPKTGDTNNIWLWVALLGVSAAALIAAVTILLVRKRKKK